MENGKINKLGIARKDEKGFYLQDEKRQEIFIAKEASAFNEKASSTWHSLLH